MKVMRSQLKTVIREILKEGQVIREITEPRREDQRKRSGEMKVHFTTEAPFELIELSQDGTGWLISSDPLMVSIDGQTQDFPIEPSWIVTEAHSPEIACEDCGQLTCECGDDVDVEGYDGDVGSIKKNRKLGKPTTGQVIDAGDSKKKDEAVERASEKWGVFLKGGSIGTRNNSTGKDIEPMSKADAQAKAKRMNKQLSPGEKKYYKMRYSARKLTGNMNEGIKKIPGVSKKAKSGIGWKKSGTSAEKKQYNKAVRQAGKKGADTDLQAMLHAGDKEYARRMNKQGSPRPNTKAADRTVITPQHALDIVDSKDKRFLQGFLKRKNELNIYYDKARQVVVLFAKKGVDGKPAYLTDFPAVNESKAEDFKTWYFWVNRRRVEQADGTFNSAMAAVQSKAPSAQIELMEGRIQLTEAKPKKGDKFVFDGGNWEVTNPGTTQSKAKMITRLSTRFGEIEIFDNKSITKNKMTEALRSPEEAKSEMKLAVDYFVGLLKSKGLKARPSIKTWKPGKTAKTAPIALGIIKAGSDSELVITISFFADGEKLIEVVDDWKDVIDTNFNNVSKKKTASYIKGRNQT